MTDLQESWTEIGAPAGLLSRDRTIAKPGFNRWLVPPAALAIHLCIGMAYGFSVFWLPLSRAIGVSDPVTCEGMSLVSALFTTSCDWRIADLGWIYTLFFVLLGSSAAIWGGWLETAGPRKAGVVAACCWCGGMVVSGIGVMTHQLWLMWLGSGFIGGIGLGLGYISPVSTLIKWFPDRRGLATGMAIMGFGGGAMIGAPLADRLMNYFQSAQGVGVWQTFFAMAAIYLVFMLAGAFAYRVPPAGWKPEGWQPKVSARKAAMITPHHVHLRDAHKTRQFWLIWLVLCLNVSAGIGVIGMASPMLQEIFAGHLIGRPDLDFTQLDTGQKAAIAAIAAGFAGLLSLFNIGGRVGWASASDRFGRKNTYCIFFILGIALYTLAPSVAHSGNQVLFVAMICVIISMYGGGFSTVPAYLADVFGTQFVGAIHGRLLTAWATAGIVGPVVVNYLREAQIAAGVPRAQAYDYTMYILAGFLALGLVCNLLVRPLDEKWFMKPEELAALQAREHKTAEVRSGSFGIDRGRFDLPALLAWAAVGIPLAWGVWMTAQKTAALFH
ncbi:OFA family MFS transporter [Paracoccus sp. PS-1]|uniref:OFA family MFS transporter n=1 Tax=unclassified Paracoccus (in: a-proteobacteria) TaxID=2688777 RepID=UPI000491D86F|nr:MULTISPECIES: OFA family MFS transporter [unclassified Paracoccus (in: a-proteobacteria)]MDQ7261819.1 OFA family MFS transporter [Paracoccus sp. PS1]